MATLLINVANHSHKAFIENSALVIADLTTASDKTDSVNSRQHMELHNLTALTLLPLTFFGAIYTFLNQVFIKVPSNHRFSYSKSVDQYCGLIMVARKLTTKNNTSTTRAYYIFCNGLTIHHPYDLFTYCCKTVGIKTKKCVYKETLQLTSLYACN